MWNSKVSMRAQVSGDLSAHFRRMEAVAGALRRTPHFLAGKPTLLVYGHWRLVHLGAPPHAKLPRDRRLTAAPRDRCGSAGWAGRHASA